MCPWSNEIQNNYEGWKITACMCSWGKLWTKDTERPKSAQSVGNKSRVLSMPPAYNIVGGVSTTPKPPLRPDLDHTLTSPHIMNKFIPSLGANRQGNLLLVLTPCYSRGPSKALLEFLMWTLVNFY